MVLLLTMTPLGKDLLKKNVLGLNTDDEPFEYPIKRDCGHTFDD